MLFCKGADTILCQLLHPSCGSLRDVTMEHLDVSVKVAGEGSCGWLFVHGLCFHICLYIHVFLYGCVYVSLIDKNKNYFILWYTY